MVTLDKARRLIGFFCHIEDNMYLKANYIGIDTTDIGDKRAFATNRSCFECILWKNDSNPCSPPTEKVIPLTDKIFAILALSFNEESAQKTDFGRSKQVAQFLLELERKEERRKMVCNGCGKQRSDTDFIGLNAWRCNKCGQWHIIPREKLEGKK